MDDSPIPGDTHLHRYEVHKRVATRLRREPGVVAVDTDPSPMRPVRLVAALDSEAFLGQTQTQDQSQVAGDATLEFEWRPQPDRDEFRIQYSESEMPWSCGWHQDQTHDDLGPTHFQVDHEAWASSYRESASFSDPHPMAILETCLNHLRDRVLSLPDSVRSNP